MVFSNSTTKLGIVEQARVKMRVDSTQWPVENIVTSCNAWLDKLINYGIGSDRHFQLDDTNHTKLPIGTANLIADQSDYSFLTDQQGNRILNLTRIDILDPSGLYRQLIPIDQAQIGVALGEFEKVANLPIYYDKIADNIIRVYPKPATSVSGGIKYYFQRSPSYFVTTDTTKQPGVANVLHEGFVVKSAYDGALTLELPVLNGLTIEMQRVEKEVEKYFENRLTDEPQILMMKYRSSR